MLRKGDFMMLEEMHRLGMYQRDIAEALGVHPRTVARVLERGRASSGERPGARRSKLDPYKGAVDELLREGVWNARVIMSVLKKQGYPGGYTILRDYIEPKRALREGKRTVRFETAPGEQMQNDWGEIWTVVAGERQKVAFAVNTLGYCRRFHFWCTESKDSEHTYEGIIRAFEYFGGATREVLCDYVPRNIIELMCPASLCGRGLEWPMIAGRAGGLTAT
jgi:transposase